MNKATIEVSKYLSFILRHKPESIGLPLDKNGWADIEQLVAKSQSVKLTRELLEFIVETNDKQRFALNDSRTKIRANQGHSIQVELNLPPETPPPVLYHGTAHRFWPSIQASGLEKGQRHHVHLTESISVARAVGSRYGKPVIIAIDANKMHAEGFEFFKTANQVWLVAAVPGCYLQLLPR